jgi:hypothetical protein
MRSTRTRSFPAALLIAAIALLVGTASAGAATIPLKGGEVAWGVKESFRKYVKGPIAQGKIEVSGGATEAADGTFRFPVGSGSYDLATHVTEVQATGTVHFTGHYEGTPTPQLDVTITNPRVVFGGETGTVYADVSSKAFAPGEPESFPNAEFAALDTSGVIPGMTAEAVTMNAVPAKLTKEGSEAFAGFYTEGTALDPVTVIATFEPTPKKEDTRPADPTPTPPPTPITTPAPVVGKAKVAVLKGTRKIGANGVVKLAGLACPSGGSVCRTVVPKHVGARIGGERYLIGVMAPKKIGAGKSAAVRARLPRPARKALGGGKLTIAVPVKLKANGKVVKQTLKVKIGGKH